MWPMLLDYSKDESKRILRRLELEAYASIISVFRAQGDLSKDKKKILQDLQQTLSISTERHRAEVRRAINDEKLATIADNIAGSMSTAEWTIEGRRLVPLMPRLVPQTAFTATANQAASAMMEKNASLPPPSQTANKDGAAAILPKPPRSLSPTSNVVVLPSGTSIHIKGMLSQDDDEDLSTPSRRSSHRSLSTDSNSAASVSTQTPCITYTTASTTLPGSSPVKITISKSPQGRPITVQSTSQPPKVILVTSAGPSSGTTVIQRSMSVPIVRTPTTTLSSLGGAGLPRSSVLIPGGPTSTIAQVVPTYASIVTTSGTSMVSTSVTMPTSTMSASPAMFTPSVQIGLGKVRPRIVPRQRYPAMIPQSKPGVVIPMGPQLVSPNQNISTRIQVSQPQHTTSAGIQVTPSQHIPGSIQVKTLSKPTIQIKQEGVKIITQGNTSKILPKPSQIAGSAGGTPVVMVNAGQSTTGGPAGVTMIPRSISSYTAHSEGKVLNITSPGGRVIATAAKATNVVTVNPKTLHLTAVKSGSGSTTVSKPNVIVVQKTQHPRFPQGQVGANIRTITTSTLPGAIDKELMGLVHKDIQGGHMLTASQSAVAGTVRGGERRVIITTSSGSGETKQVRPISIIHRGRTDGDGKTSSLLAELIQAVGIPSEGGEIETTAQGTDPYDFENAEGGLHTISTVALSTSSPLRINQPQQLTRLSTQRHPLVQEVNDGAEESFTFGLQSGDKSGGQDADIGPEQVFTLEQAMSLLNKEVVDLTESETSPVSSSAAVVPSLLNSGSFPPSTSHLPVQPKFSILSTTKVEPVSREPPPLFLGGVVISPEEGLKEGQLDTQTGLFYQVTASDPTPDGDASSSGQSPATYAATSSSPPSTIITIQATTAPIDLQQVKPAQLDLLSSSLAEAQINLDSYNEEDEGEEEEYDEEEEEEDIDLETPSNDGQLQAPPGSRPGMAEVLREETAKDGTRILTVSNPASSQQDSVTAHSNHLVSLPSQLTRSSSISSSVSSVSSSPSSTFVPVQETIRAPIIKAPGNTISVLPQAQITVSHKPSQLHPSVLPIAVSVEKSNSIIALKIDDLSQKALVDDHYVHNSESDSCPAPPVEAEDVPTEATVALLQEDLGSTAGSDLESQSDGMIVSDPSGLLRSSKRKRKHPSGIDESAQTAPGGWTNQYDSFEDFQADMELIRTNCYLYNSEGTKVRRDCDEVMTYYKSELSKLQVNKAFSQTASPLKKAKLDDKNTPKS
ncbi:hypothetical protein Btru_023128 [Bulinus truncatus]|nr:hypothetical protein Btru_023128 [Bulinus truncatus]